MHSGAVFGPREIIHQDIERGVESRTHLHHTYHQEEEVEPRPVRVEVRQEDKRDSEEDVGQVGDDELQRQVDKHLGQGDLTCWQRGRRLVSELKAFPKHESRDRCGDGDGGAGADGDDHPVHHAFQNVHQTFVGYVVGAGGQDVHRGARQRVQHAHDSELLCDDEAATSDHHNPHQQYNAHRPCLHQRARFQGPQHAETPVKGDDRGDKL